MNWVMNWVTTRERVRHLTLRANRRTLSGDLGALPVDQKSRVIFQAMSEKLQTLSAEFVPFGFRTAILDEKELAACLYVASSRIFWLKASVDAIVSRIQGDTERPALTSGKTFTEEVTEVLEQRIPKYKSAAQYEIDTDELTPEQVADRVIEIWKEEG